MSKQRLKNASIYGDANVESREAKAEIQMRLGTCGNQLRNSDGLDQIKYGTFLFEAI